MLSFKKTLTVAAGVASAFAFGASHASADTTDSQNRPTDYVVKAGDTLNKLSSEYNTTVEDIAAKNNITDVNLIFVGQHLTFAEAAASQATAAPAQAPVAQAPAAPVAAPVQQRASTTSTSCSACSPSCTTSIIFSGFERFDCARIWW